MRDLQRDIAHHERLHAKQPPQKPPAPEPTFRFLLQVPDQPLCWLWLGRIPLGHLTLLDAAPGSGLSLLALALAACVSSGSPLPNGTPTQPGYVVLLAPYDAPSDTLKPRLEATSYDREAGRKMLLRMHQAGELVSPARGLYTTAHHPCLLHFTNEPSPIPTVPNVANVSSVSSQVLRLLTHHRVRLLLLQPFPCLTLPPACFLLSPHGMRNEMHFRLK